MKYLILNKLDNLSQARNGAFRVGVGGAGKFLDVPSDAPEEIMRAVSQFIRNARGFVCTIGL